MAYPKEFFEPQIAFAKKVAAVTGKPLEDVFLKYTYFYKCFHNPGWDFDPSQPIWQNFIQDLKQEPDILDLAYRYHMAPQPPEEKHAGFGCFNYDYNQKEKFVHIHFPTGDKKGVLSLANKEKRINELKTMFSEIKEKHPDAQTVMGFSWLYNIDAYKRLYPPQYVEGAERMTDWFQSLSLWGQFLDGEGKIRRGDVSAFLDRIKNQQTVDDLVSCFTYISLKPQCDIRYFYEWYGI